MLAYKSYLLIRCIQLPQRPNTLSYSNNTKPDINVIELTQILMQHRRNNNYRVLWLCKDYTAIYVCNSNSLGTKENVRITQKSNFVNFLKILFGFIYPSQYIYCFIIIFLHSTQYKTKKKPLAESILKFQHNNINNTI